MSDRGVELSVKDQMTLELESRRWRYPTLKEAEIRAVFSESSTRYDQRLNADEPAALTHAPLLVNRLRRLREQRRSAGRAR